MILAPIVPKKLGRCPSCHALGAVGEVCIERVCKMRGYGFIPFEERPEPVEPVEPVEDDPLIGQRCDDFLLVSLIGAGGFGRVYRALQLPIQRPTAVKLLPLETGPLPATPELRWSRFEAEIKALAQLSHPNIVRLFHYGTHRGVPFLAMELIEDAQTLRAEIDARAARGRGFSLAEVEAILMQVLAALEEAHKHGILHRDIKPENIMIESVAGHGTFIRLLDFGQAKFTGDHKATSLLLGTPAYMAHEQLTRGQLGPWTDLYAVGVLAYQLLTGEQPYGTTDVQAMLAHKLDRAYDPCARLAPGDHPQALRDFLAQALAIDPGARHADARAMREGLNSALIAIGIKIDPQREIAVARIASTWSDSAPGEPAAPPAEASTRNIRAPNKAREPARVLPPTPVPTSPRFTGPRTVGRVRVSTMPKSVTDASSAEPLAPPASGPAPQPATPRRRTIALTALMAMALVLLLSLLAPPARSPVLTLVTDEPAAPASARARSLETTPPPVPHRDDAPPRTAWSAPESGPMCLTGPAPTPSDISDPEAIELRIAYEQAIAADVPPPARPRPATPARTPPAQPPPAPARTAADDPQVQYPSGLHRAVLVTVPAGADVLIDGAFVGRSPMTVQWPPGVVSQVSVRLEGHEPASFELSDQQDAKMLRLELVESSGGHRSRSN